MAKKGVFDCSGSEAHPWPDILISIAILTPASLAQPNTSKTEMKKHHQCFARLKVAKKNRQNMVRLPTFLAQFFRGDSLRLPQSKTYCVAGGRREFVYQINRSPHHI